MPALSVEVTSALMSPSTMLQISRMCSSNGLPSLAISDGLVVTPSTMPQLAPLRSSSRLAVSRKNFTHTVYQNRFILILKDHSRNGSAGVHRHTDPVPFRPAVRADAVGPAAPGTVGGRPPRRAQLHRTPSRFPLYPNRPPLRSVRSRGELPQRRYSHRASL